MKKRILSDQKSTGKSRGGNPSDRKKLEKIIEKIDVILKSLRALESKESAKLSKVHPSYKISALNLLHYRALRSKNLSGLQRLLGDVGLSRLSQTEGHTLASLVANRQLCQLLLGSKKNTIFNSPALSIQQSRQELNHHVTKLLGKRPKKRRVRIMVTMPALAATDLNYVKDLLTAGMNIARINCAHDRPEIWHKMIDNIRLASNQTAIPCRVAMDLAGPKIRTGVIEPGPEIVKIRPEKNEQGAVIKGAPVWIGRSNDYDEMYHIPITIDINFTPGKKLYFKDTRGKKRSVIITDILKDGCRGMMGKTSYIQSNMPIFSDKNLKNEIFRIGQLPAKEGAIFLNQGDHLILTATPVVSKLRNKNDTKNIIPSIHCSNPEVIKQVKNGESVMFDDGKFEGSIVKKHENHILIKITKIRRNGAKLKADKGINFPKSNLRIRGLTKKDKTDLQFVGKHADIVNMSFVNSTKDVAELLKAISKEGKLGKIGVILKIETKKGFKNLTRILLSGMQTFPIGIMIARGDLALEVGWQKVAAIQREIMKLCRAADVPDIWATQVFESLTKYGIPSRAEMTDIWMAQRSECVMLNKGPYIIDAIKMLDNILIKIEAYHDKNAPMLPSIYKAIRE